MKLYFLLIPYQEGTKCYTVLLYSISFLYNRLADVNYLNHNSVGFLSIRILKHFFLKQICTNDCTLTEYLIILSSEVSSCGESEPEVIRCLKLTLINSVKGIVKQIVSLMHSWEATENYGTYQHKQIVPESLLKTVPKEWNYTPREMKRKESGKCGWNLCS